MSSTPESRPGQPTPEGQPKEPPPLTLAGSRAKEEQVRAENQARAAQLKPPSFIQRAFIQRIKEVINKLTSPTSPRA